MKYLEKTIIANAYTYEDYRQLIEQKFAERKSTGPDHSVEMLNYTSLNLARMRRLDKKNRITEDTRTLLKKIDQPLTWIVITEGWCGDAAQIIPVLHQMASTSKKITLRFILRDQNLPVIDSFLTDGGRSIPKVIILNTQTSAVLGTWGPRPEEAQQLVLAGKEQLNKLKDDEQKQIQKEDTSKQLHLWYAKNKTLAIQAEFSAVITNLKHEIG